MWVDPFVDDGILGPDDRSLSLFLDSRPTTPMFYTESIAFKPLLERKRSRDYFTGLPTKYEFFDEKDEKQRLPSGSGESGFFSDDDMPIEDIERPNLLLQVQVQGSNPSAPPASEPCNANPKPDQRRRILRRQRHDANMRERRRMRHMNEAYNDIRAHLPGLEYSSKTSKLDLLKEAVRYIEALASMRDEYDAQHNIRFDFQNIVNSEGFLLLKSSCGTLKQRCGTSTGCTEPEDSQWFALSVSGRICKTEDSLMKVKTSKLFIPQPLT